MSFVEEEEEVQEAATVILMGRRRSGKSSILEAVFNKMRPWETAYIQSTARPEVFNVTSLFNINIMELPGQMDFFDNEYADVSVFRSTGAIIYVIDAQDEYHTAIRNLIRVAERAFPENPNIRFEVLVHKIDGLSEEFRDDTVRDIKDSVNEMLFADGLDSSLSIDFYQTSIYDETIYEVLSKIISRLIPELPSLERLLDNLVQHSNIEKAFLCDLKSKLYFVTDSSPLDSKIYEVCAEFIDLNMDLDGLFCGGRIEDEISDDDDESEINSHLGSSRNSTISEPTTTKRIRSISKLSPNVKLYLYEVLSGVCLIAFIREDESTANDMAADAVLDYNANVFRKGLEKMFADRL